MNKLLNVREEIVDNLRSTERPDSLNTELLDEVYRIDTILDDMAQAALFATQRELYRVPPVSPEEQPVEAVNQQEGLF